MKNVAGYDVSRLMTGSFGTLGTDAGGFAQGASRAANEVTRALRARCRPRRSTMNEWAGPPAADHGDLLSDGALSVRLSGAAPAVEHGTRGNRRRARSGRRRFGGVPCASRRCPRSAEPCGASRCSRPRHRSTPRRQLLEWNGACAGFSLGWSSSRRTRRRAEQAATPRYSAAASAAAGVCVLRPGVAAPPQAPQGCASIRTASSARGRFTWTSS